MPAPLDLLPPLLAGLAVTLKLTAGGILVAIFCAFTAGLGRISLIPPIRWISVVYIEVFRGTSALVQLFWFYFVLPLFGIDLPALWVGIVVLGLNAGAYGAEVVRGAIQSVSKGQYEAATALNMTRLQTLWRVIIPQAAVSMLPPFGNIFIELLKNTALASLITLSELTFTGQIIRADTFRTEEIFALLLIIYFMIALCITAVVRLLEWRLGRGLDRGGIA